MPVCGSLSCTVDKNFTGKILKVVVEGDEYVKIAIASDHAGFPLKEVVSEHLQAAGHEIIDFGTNSTASVDYPDYARPAAQAVANRQADRGVVICGTGLGVCMTANKVSGIRGARCTDEYSARMSRRHNDANVLCLGQRVTGVGLALSIVDAWLAEPFEGGRHARRVAKIEASL